jgi:hypothetical protein
MIAKDKIESALIMELAYLPKNMTMRGPNVFKSVVLKEFITIPKLNVSETLFEVVLQREHEDVLVMSEVIRPTVVAPVAVT